jgi:hypothetical protein
LSIIADVDDDPNPLGSISAFAEFHKDIADRCEPGEGSGSTTGDGVDSYRFLVGS